MNRTFRITLALLFPFVMIACGSEEESKNDKELQEEVVIEDCNYSYVSESSSVMWTAYKTSERAAVGGSFDSVLVEVPDSNSSVIEALRNASFDIYTESVSTNNPARDATIRKYFFATLADNGLIKGDIKIVEGDNKEGGGTVKLKINGVTRDIGFKYSVVDNLITIKTKINLSSFNGDPAIKSLNDFCDDLHKGSDGVSKLWPDIEIEVKAALNKDC